MNILLSDKLEHAPCTKCMYKDTNIDTFPCNNCNGDYEYFTIDDNKNNLGSVNRTGGNTLGEIIMEILNEKYYENKNLSKEEINFLDDLHNTLFFSIETLDNMWKYPKLKANEYYFHRLYMNLQEALETLEEYKSNPIDALEDFAEEDGEF